MDRALLAITLCRPVFEKMSQIDDDKIEIGNSVDNPGGSGVMDWIVNKTWGAVSPETKEKITSDVTGMSKEDREGARETFSSFGKIKKFAPYALGGLGLLLLTMMLSRRNSQQAEPEYGPRYMSRYGPPRGGYSSTPWAGFGAY